MKCPRSIIFLMLCLTIVLLFAPEQSSATHFAFGTWTWSLSSSVYSIELTQAWRWSAWWSDSKAFTEGMQASTTNLQYSPSISGKSSRSTILTVQSKNVDSLTSGGYWWFGLLDFTLSTGVNSPQYLYFLNCCRISTLLENNHDQNDKHSVSISVTDTGRTSGLYCTGFPRESLEVSSSTKSNDWDYSTPCVEPLSYSITYAISPGYYDSSTWTSELPRSTPCGMLSTTIAWNAACANKLTYGSDGVAHWEPINKGGYAFSVTMTSAGNANVWVQLDFVILVVAECDSTDTTCNHAPYFVNPPTNWIVDCTATVPAIHSFNVADQDAGQTLQLQNSPVPSGFSLTTSTVAGTSSAGPTGTFNLGWTPAIDSINVVICLKAVDSEGLSTQGTTCPDFTVVKPDYLYASGTVRVWTDDLSTYLFDSSTALAGNPVSSALDTTTRKPVWQTNPTVSSTIFNQWWSDSTESFYDVFLYTAILIRYWNNAEDSSGVERVYSYRNTTFYVGDYVEDESVVGTYPYFTYEIHTSFDYLGTETLNFASAGGEMWVFMNSVLMLSHYTTLSTTNSTITYTQMANAGLTAGDSYNIDIFYTHRSPSIAPVWQVEWANSTKCSAITLLAQSGTNIPYNINFDANFTTSSIVGSSNVAITSAGYLQLLSSSQTATSSSAWFALTDSGTTTSNLLKVLSGFEATFTFNMAKASSTTNMDGFAFVLQAQSPTARGGDGASLGYSGLTNSIAIEFDSRYSSAYDNTATDQHISLHTYYSGINSAIESSKYWPLGTQPAMDLTDLPFTFDNGTDHVIRVQFLPGSVYSLLYVFVNDNILPLYTAQLDATEMGTMFESGAYVGFTAGASDSTAAGTILIKEWKLLLIPPDAGYTGPTPAGTTSWSAVAGTQVTVDVQLRDACDQNLLVNGEASMFEATMSYKYSSDSTVAVTIADAGSGVYTFTGLPTKTDTYMLNINLTTLAGTSYINNQPSGFTITVLPSDNIAANSYFSFSTITPGLDNVANSSLFTQVSGAGVACASFNTSGQPTQTGSQFATLASFNTWVTSQLMIACVSYGDSTTAAVANSIYQASGGSTSPISTLTSYAWVSTRTSTSDSWAIHASAGSDEEMISLSDEVTNAAGDVYIYLEAASKTRNQRAMILIAPSYLSVPSQSTGGFWFMPRDTYYNYVTSVSNSITYSFSPDLGATTDPVACTNYLAGSPVMWCEFSTNSSGTYLLSVLTASVPVPQMGYSSAASATVLVTAGAASYLTSQQSGLTITTTVDKATSFTVTLYDATGNRVLTQDGIHEITGIDFVSTTTNEVVFSLTDYTTEMVWQQSDQLYNITYTSTNAGEFYVFIYINGVQMVSSEGLTLAINPGDPSTLSYVAEDDESDGSFNTAPSAGVTISYSIYARDKYENLCTNTVSGYSFSVSVSGTGAPSSVSVTSLGSGRYRFSLTPTTIEAWTVSVYLVDSSGSELIKLNSASTADAVWTFTPVAGAISQESLFSLQCDDAECSTTAAQTTYTAGSKNIPFLLSLYDEYSNPITAAQSSSVISAALSLSLQTTGSTTYALILDFDSLTQTSGNVYSGTITTTVASNYSLTLTLASNSQTLQFAQTATDNALSILIDPAATDMPTVKTQSALPSQVANNYNNTLTIIDVDVYGNLRPVGEQTFSISTSGLGDYDTTATCTGTTTEATYECILSLSSSVPTDSFVLTTTAGGSVSSNGDSFTTDMTVYQGAGVLYARVESVVIRGVTYSMLDSDGNAAFTFPSFYSGESVVINVYAYSSADYTGQQSLSSAPSLTLIPASGSSFTSTTATGSTVNDKSLYAFTITFKTISLNYNFDISLSGVTSLVNADNDYIPTVVAGDLSSVRSSYASGTSFTHVPGAAVVISISPYDVNGNAITAPSSLVTYSNTTGLVTGITSIISASHPLFSCAWNTTASLITCTLESATATGQIDSALYSSLFNSVGTFSIGLVYSSATIASRYITMTTTYAALDLSKSYLSLTTSKPSSTSATNFIGNPYTAEASGLIYLIAYDSYGNSITSVSGLSSSLALSVSNSTIASSAASCSWAAVTGYTNVYSNCVVFDYISRSGITLQLSDANGVSPSVVAYIRSGVPTARTTTTAVATYVPSNYGLAYPNGTAVTAVSSHQIGGTFDFFLTVLDSNNLPFLYDLTSSTGDRSAAKISMYTVNSANSPSTYVTASVASFNISNPGVWEFTLDSTALTVIGNYYLDISVTYGTTTVSIALYEFQITAGEPYLPRATFTLPTVVIGQTNAAFTFQLYDVSGNLVTSDPGDLVVSIRQNTVQSCTDWHSAEIDSSYPVLTSSTIILGALSLDATTGLWTQLVTPVVTGSFTFYIALTDGSSTLACSQLVNTAFTVHTGLTDAHKSFYMISKSSTLPTVLPASSLSTISVGTTYYVYIQLCDTQGNFISDNDLDSDNLFAFTDGNGEPTEEEGLANGSSVLVNQLLDYQNIGYSNGIWRYAFVAQKTYTSAEFAIYLNQSSDLSDSSSARVITRVNGTYNSVQAPQSITVTHAAPVSIAFQNLPSVLNYTAGQALSFELYAFDSLGNIVNDAILHYVTATVNRDGSLMESGGTALGSYYFSPTSPTSSAGVSTLGFTIAWEGSYEINVIMYNRDTAAYINEATITIIVNPASCADLYLATHPNATASEIPAYRCQSTGDCVMSYSDCTAAVDQTTCATGYTRCSTTDTECVLFTACSVSAIECDDGTYASTESECPVISPCPSGQVTCPNDSSQCRSSVDDCPSDVACSPGLVVCPNQLTCATSVAECPVIPTSVYTACAATYTNGVVCPDATCVASSSDCATDVTCPSGEVLCLTDYSCRANATVCPSPQQYGDIENTTSCAANSQILCWDSSCAADYASCPSRITCPVGDVLCSDSQCQASLADCYEEASLSDELESSTTSLACTVNEFRCDDGTCVSNKVLCPTVPTCGSSTPILCSDLSCQSSLALCTIPSTCDDTTPLRCPSSGQCVASLNYCTSTKTCPDATPVLCASTRTCVASESDCSASSSCPAAFPYTCASSGACRASITDCPTTFSCPSTTPVQCPDGSCQVDLPLCTVTTTTEDESGSTTTTSSASDCPSDHIMCPSGNCIPSSMTLLGCPTQVTCPTDSYRCADGTCRSSCTNVATSSCTSQGLISCPISSAGQACAATLVQCPRGVTCPLDSPVKCFDASCAPTLASCPDLPSSSPPSTQIPCPDGSWAYDTCPTAVTCPDSTPFTCYDQTCQVSLDQCPDPTPCDPTSSTPYRCTTGACAATPWACGSIDGTVCDTSTLLVKCPLYDGTATCVAASSSCPNTTSSETDSSTTQTADEIYTSTCASGYTYCRDGSCVETSTSCPTYSCPLSYPYLCEDGSCALNSTQCPASNGCAWDTPTKCPGVGTCVALLRNCPAPSCASDELACPDGSCATTCQYAASGCLSTQVRCADGTCVDDYDICTAQANTDYANSCPPGTPYECSSGLCVSVQSECPILNSTAACTSTSKPVLCADGICRASTDLCPIVKTCETDTVRCDDGSCRSSSDLCPTADTCPTGEFRCKQTDFTSVNILDGICSSDGLCYAANGCHLFNSISTPTRCDNGRCVSDATLCDTNVRLSNGCVANSTWTDPVKCWNGACAQTSGDCDATNGCPAATPFRCANGDCIADSTACPTVEVDGVTEQESCQGVTCADGSCVDEGDEASCLTSFGCPVATPIRCADGTCKKYSAAYRAPKYGLTTAQINEWTCQPTIYCTSSSYTMCEDGQCVLSASQCSSVSYSCNSTQVRCLDGTCSDSYAHCDMVQETNSDGEVVTDGSGNVVWVGSTTSISSCPSSAPALCTDGSCVSTMADCSTSTNPASTTITGSSSASKKNSSSVIAQVLCYDGTYRDSYAECISFAKLVFATNSSDSSSSSSSSSTCLTYCSDGTCISSDVTATQACSPIPACSSGYYRCYDGTCRTSCQTDSSTATTSLSWASASYMTVADNSSSVEISPVECEDGQQLCVDGVCRTSSECPQFAGCSFEPAYRYQCPSRECASGPDDCTAAANRNADTYAKLLLKETEADLAQAESNVAPIATTSLVTQPNSLIHSFVVAATTTSYKSCSSNCIATQSIYDTSVAYDPTRDQSSYTIAPLSTAFTVTLSSGLTVNTSLDANIYFSPVAQSVYYNASNKVTYSRIDDFDGSTTFTAAQTVLSPVFSCSAGDGITDPFNVNVAIASLFDRSGSQKAAPADVCLARLRRYPEHNYATWECLFNDTLRASGSTQYTIRQSSTAALNQASSYITTCIDSDLSTTNSTVSTQATTTIVPAVYAFIHSPLTSGQVYTEPSVSWFDGNVIWIMIVAILAVLALFALVYAVSRLSRYKSKTEQVKEEIEVMEREVDDLENYGGRRYDGGEVAYTANPMAQSLEAQQELQKMSDADRLQLQKENLAKQQAESVERQEVIQQLEDANAQELAMLEATRAKLQQNQRRRVD